MPEKTESLIVTLPEESPEATSPVRHWDSLVRDRFRNRCGNCGGDERLRAKMIVPPEAGGQVVLENGVLLCRSCEMATDSVTQQAVKQDQRLVNFWVSQGLFERIKFGLHNYSGFTSMGGLVRYLMAKYVEDETRFDDLELYQDEGCDTKVNVWVDKDRYNTFKALLDRRGVTVTDAIKSLIRMYEENAETMIEPRKSGGDA